MLFSPSLEQGGAAMEIERYVWWLVKSTRLKLVLGSD